MTKAEPVVKITGIDEHGPLLGWYRHWADFPIGTEFYASPPAGAEVDFGADAVRIVEAILQNLGIGHDASREPGADPRRDRLARLIEPMLPPTPSTDAVRRQAREEALEEAAGAADAYGDSHGQWHEYDDEGAGEERAARRIAERIRALSTPPAGAAALNEGEE